MSAAATLSCCDLSANSSAWRDCGLALRLPAWCAGAAGAAAALVLVLAVGVAVHAPLSRVPENTLKYAVGLMLSSFGTFWAAEGAGVTWPWSDATILLILVVYAVISFVFVNVLRRRHAAAEIAELLGLDEIVQGHGRVRPGLGTGARRVRRLAAALQHLQHPAGDAPHLRRAHAARGQRRCAESNA